MGDKSGLNAKRLPRYEGGMKQCGIKLPNVLVEEFEKQAAAEGVSFGRYVYEHFIEPNLENPPKPKIPAYKADEQSQDFG